MREKLHIGFIFIFIFYCNPIISQDVSEGLLTEYHFNGTTNDSSENGFDAINNGALYTQDRFGVSNSAILFDGINDYLELPNVSDLKPQLPISFSFWIRYDSNSSTDRDVFNTSFEEDRNTGVYFNSQMSTGNFAVNYGDGAYNYTSSSRRTYVTNQAIETGEWTHIAIVVSSASDMKIYIDCIENGGSFSGSGGDLVYSNLPGNIGRHDRDLGSPANYFKGALDDFRYWNRDLTNEEIISLCDNLDVTEFNFNEDAIHVYPNPSNGEFNIVTERKLIQKIEVYNALGQLTFQSKFDTKINLAHLTKGVYYISFVSDEVRVNKKILIN